MAAREVGQGPGPSGSAQQRTPPPPRTEWHRNTVGAQETSAVSVTLLQGWDWFGLHGDRAFPGFDESP